MVVLPHPPPPPPPALNSGTNDASAQQQPHPHLANAAINSHISVEELLYCLTRTNMTYDDVLQSDPLFRCCVKVKTIGDVLLVVSNVDPAQDNSYHLNRLALLSSKLAETLLESVGVVAVAGLHVGPVIAGVIGEEALSYDVFGDTVNTASRIMTSASTVTTTTMVGGGSSSGNDGHPGDTDAITTAALAAPAYKIFVSGDYATAMEREQEQENLQPPQPKAAKDGAVPCPDAASLARPSPMSPALKAAMRGLVLGPPLQRHLKGKGATTVREVLPATPTTTTHA